VTRIDKVVDRLATTADPAARHRLIRQARMPVDVVFLERLTDLVPIRGRADLVQAERLAEAAAWIADTLATDYAAGRSLRAQGHVLTLAGRSEAALEAYQSALARFKKASKPLEDAITRSGALQVLIYLGRYTQAFTWARRARRVFEAQGDRLRLARLDSNFANVLYRQDRFAEALALYKRAHQTFERVGAPNDVAITLRNLAVCLISLNHFDQALATHRQARRYAERHHLPQLVAEADYNIAYLYYLRGEYSRAIELYEATRRRCERLGDRYHQALCDLDESELSLELNLTSDGARLARHALTRFDDLGMNYEAAKSVTWLAIAASQAGNPARALRYFDTARRRFRREGNLPWLALLDLYQAIVLLDDERLDEARKLADAARIVFLETNLVAKAALSQLVLARVALRAGDTATAEHWCDAAIERLATTQAPVLRFQASYVRGQIEEARGDTARAADAYLDSHAWLESLRTDLRADETKVAFLKDKLVIYESVVAVALAGGARVSRTGVFTFIEQAKSRSLADLIAFRAHRMTSRAAGTRVPVRRLHQLRESLNWCYREIDIRELSADQPESRAETLRATARKLENEITRALTEIRTTDDEYASLQNAGTIELPAVQASLREDEVVLEYYSARGMLCACVIGRHSFEVVTLGAASVAHGHAQLLQFQLSKFRLGAKYQRDFSSGIDAATTAHLQALYRELLAPLRSRIAGRWLTIVPHGFLHYVPFHALHDGAAHLIDDGPISYAPSASVLHLCRQKRPPRARASLVLGVSDRAAPHIDEEVDAVAAALPRSRAYKGRRASAARLKEDGPKSRVIHIATHAAFRMDNPMFSAIQLGDGPVSVFDLYDLRISAELVTLSGCGTGLNALIGGDELLGLVRGWLYAGAQSVLVSLWDVHDRSTAQLMADFYERLRSTDNRAVALRGAMLAARDRDPHPYYWAPFVLIGAPAYISGPPTTPE
jgi:CHAT domain-containing protein/tetratricopeptide (TPR) repeat protein